MKKFVHLHVHTHYSLLEGLPKIPDLVKKAKEFGMSAVAITDYGSMYGAIEFYQKCKEAGIKPIIGFEAFVAPNGMDLKRGKEDSKTFHLVLLAEDYEGYRNLIMLSSEGHLRGFYYRPRVDKDLLKKYSKGVIALSGCMGGELPQMINQGESWDKIVETALQYKEIFGNNEKGEPKFFLELQDHLDREGQFNVNNQLIKLSEETGIPLVVTRDVHYLSKDDAYAQDILTCIKDGRTVNEPGRWSLVNIDRSFSSGEDIAERFHHVESAIENTLKIAERCNVELKLNVWHFPSIDLPEGKTVEQVLEENVWAGLKKLNYETSQFVNDRIALELSVINNKGYTPYFLTVADYVNYARDNGVVVTTRGSAAGSLVSYAIGITTVDPLAFKLPFERFLNPFRPSAPDIDIDFADDKRDQMIEYVTNKYGSDKVAQIITFGTMMARAAVRDVGRALGFPYHFCDQISKLIPFGKQGFQMTIKHALEIEPELKKLYGNNPDAKKLLDLAQKVEGCNRHTSIHAAGVVISPTPLTDFTPIQKEVGGERITTQYEMKSVEAAGVLKMDFLGIRNLSILGKAIEIVEKTAGKKVDLYHIPLDDKKTYEMLAKGETMGVFQMSGSGMTRYLKELKPSTIFDIMAMVALFRPGPMESIPEFIKRKHNAEYIEYIDERLKKILDRSYGVMVYQDDVLLTAIEIAGYTWEEADKFRKAMGKKIPEEMAKQKDKFLHGCKEFGKLSELKAQRLWQLIEPFAAYGFNKAHAASYGVLAYQTAYMKANFPLQYMAAVLTAESDDLQKVAAIVHECDRMGVDVLPPDVNESFRDFAMIQVAEGEKPRIRFGLKAVKNLGEHIVETIYQIRKLSGTYKTLEDFLERVNDKDLNKKSLEALAKCGALDCFGFDRAVLLDSIESIIEYHKEKTSGTAPQNSLFASIDGGDSARVRLVQNRKATDDEKLTWEKELLGLYISSHPFKPFAKALQGVIMPIAMCNEDNSDSWAVIGGVVGDTKKKITKSGKVMMFASIEDNSGKVDVLVFPKTYEATSDLWVDGTIIWCMAKTSDEEGDNKLFVEKAGVLNYDNLAFVKQQMQFSRKGSTYAADNAPAQARLLIKMDPANKIDVESLKSLFKNFPGDYQVVFIMNGNAKKLVTNFYVSANNVMMEELNKLVGADNSEIQS